MTTDAI